MPGVWRAPPIVEDQCPEVWEDMVDFVGVDDIRNSEPLAMRKALSNMS